MLFLITAHGTVRVLCKRTRTLVAKSRACSSRCCGLSSVVYHGWEGKCSEILATPSYSTNPRVNKDI